MTRASTWVIDGIPRSGKNSKRMAVNARTGQRFPMRSKAVETWRADAIRQLAAQRMAAKLRAPMPGPLAIRLDLYQRGTLNDCDGDNVEAAVLDVLKGLIITDDNTRVIAGGCGWVPYVDRSNPRVVITITPITQQEEAA